jgi:NADH:ubiquinone reductase (non-electrogenic)
MPKRALCIIGTGFGAFSLIKSIDADLYAVTVVSPRNHFIFTPLLPSTTVGTIEFRSIIEPIRSAKKGIAFVEAMCTGIDTAASTILCRSGTNEPEFPIPFDLAVIASGAVSNTYNVPGVAEHAVFLRELADARAIRQRIVECFERADAPSATEEECRRLLQFVIVGGGPTGVEFAAELHDYLKSDLRRAYPKHIDNVRIIIVEASDHLLSTFDATLRSYTLKHFLRQHIDVRTHTSVRRVESHRVHLSSGETLPYGLLVWSTGIGPSPLIRALPFEKNSQSRLIVDEFLRIPSRPNIYALGDCATPASQNLPATGQVAQQEGYYLGRSLNRLARGKTVKPYRYRNLGMLAYIGSNEALADLEAVKGHGFSTWLFWRSVYLTRLVSWKNKILVLFDWFKTFVFGRDVSRF